MKLINDEIKKIQNFNFTNKTDFTTIVNVSINKIIMYFDKIYKQISIHHYDHDTKLYEIIKKKLNNMLTIGSFKNTKKTTVDNILSVFDNIQHFIKSINNYNNTSSSETDVRPPSVTNFRPRSVRDVRPPSVTNFRPRSVTDVRPRSETDVRPPSVTNFRPRSVRDVRPPSVTNFRPRSVTDVIPPSVTNTTGSNSRSLDHNNNTYNPFKLFNNQKQEPNFTDISTGNSLRNTETKSRWFRNPFKKNQKVGISGGKRRRSRKNKTRTRKRKTRARSHKK